MMIGELYIDGVLVDVSENTSVALTINSNLFGDVSKIASNNTYTIKLPRTAKNEGIFFGAARVQHGGADARITHTARYIVDGVPVIDNGVAQLLTATDEFEMSISWGVASSMKMLLEGDVTLRSLSSTASLTFNVENSPEDYTTAMTRGYFYAGYDPFFTEVFSDWLYFNTIENIDIPTEMVTFQSGKVLTGAIGERLTMSIAPSAGHECAIVPFWLGCSVRLQSLVGTADAHSWAVVDELYNVIYVGEENTALFYLFAPTRAAWLIINKETGTGQSEVTRTTIYSPTNSVGGAFGVALRNDYILPSVSVKWIFEQLQADYGMSVDFGTSQSFVESLVVPLVNMDGTQGNSAVFFGEFDSSTSLGNKSLTIYINDSIMTETTGQSVSTLHVQNDCSVSLDVNVKCSRDVSRYTSDSSIFFDSATYMIVHVAPFGDADNENTFQIGMNGVEYWEQKDIDTGRVYRVIAGTGSVDLKAGDEVTFELKNDNISSLFDFAMTGGFVRVIADMGDKVARGEQFPIVKNLPDIKVADLIKYLCAVTGTYATQTGGGVLQCVEYGSMSAANAVDWSDKVSTIIIPDETSWSVSGWAQRNKWKYKSDEGQTENHDGVLALSGNLEGERDVIEFPFAASEGNNIPVFTRPQMYTSRNTDSTARSGDGLPTFKGCEPRIMVGYADAGNKMQLTFDGLDMQQIIDDKYVALQTALQAATVIKVKAALSVVDIMSFDEKKLVYLRQFASYFAVQKIEVNIGEVATLTLLRVII